MHICLHYTSFVLIFLATNVISSALDPWDVDVDVANYESNKDPEPWSNLKTPKVTANHVNNEDPPNPKPSSIPNRHKPVASQPKNEGDYFFKRLLKLLTLEKIQDTGDEMIEAGIDFKFSASNYKLIEQYISSPDELTPVQYRRIDGLLSDSISKESYIRKNILFYLNKYCLHLAALLVAALCSYFIYHTNWSLFFTKRKLLCIFFAIVYGWETMIAIKEVEIKYYEEVVESITPCTWLFWNVECQPLRAAVSHYLYYIHPLQILSNLMSRLINSQGSILFLGVLNFTRHLSDQLPYGVRTPVYIGLNIFLFYIVIAIFIALIRNIVFNTPVSVKFLFLELNFKQKFKDMRGKNYSSSSMQNQSEVVNSLSGDNLKNFLKMVVNVTNPVQNRKKILPSTDRGTFPVSKNKLRKKNS